MVFNDEILEVCVVLLGLGLGLGDVLGEGIVGLGSCTVNGGERYFGDAVSYRWKSESDRPPASASPKLHQMQEASFLSLPHYWSRNTIIYLE